MQQVDIEDAKYKLGKLAREFDSQVFIQKIEEHYNGEFYNVIFQRGSHTYTLEVDGTQFASWFETDGIPFDMEQAVRLAAEELES